MNQLFARFGIIVCLCLPGFHLFAQEAKKLTWNEQFVIEKTGKAYPAQDKLSSLNGRSYDFTTSNRPAFVYISSESCLPCKFELPLYIEACKQYPQFDFVYYDTDLEAIDTAIIRKKFGADFNLPNLYVLYQPYDYFYEHQLFLGFPTKYFIGSDRIVKTVQLGGWMVKEKVLAEWQPVLSQLQ